MNEIVQRLMAEAGLSEEQAASAVQTVVGFIKEKLPAPIAAQVDNIVSDGDGGGGSQSTGGIGGALGSVFGGR